ncbi:MAG: hypothetical protein J0H68_05215 [Sphingobacteriia bacterium]|nr:hypothetical protein [Sphingobacteriia bacterium]
MSKIQEWYYKYNERQCKEIKNIQNKYQELLSKIEKEELPDLFLKDENLLPILFTTDPKRKFPIVYNPSEKHSSSFAVTYNVDSALKVVRQAIFLPIQLQNHLESVIQLCVNYNIQNAKYKGHDITGNSQLYGPTTLLFENIIQWTKLISGKEDLDKLEKLITARKGFLEQIVIYLPRGLTRNEKSKNVIKKAFHIQSYVSNKSTVKEFRYQTIEKINKSLEKMLDVITFEKEKRSAAKILADISSKVNIGNKDLLAYQYYAISNIKLPVFNIQELGSSQKSGMYLKVADKYIVSVITSAIQQPNSILPNAISYENFEELTNKQIEKFIDKAHKELIPIKKNIEKVEEIRRQWLNLFRAYQHFNEFFDFIEKAKRFADMTGDLGVFYIYSWVILKVFESYKSVYKQFKNDITTFNNLLKQNYNPGNPDLEYTYWAPNFKSAQTNFNNSINYFESLQKCINEAEFKIRTYNIDNNIEKEVLNSLKGLLLTAYRFVKDDSFNKHIDIVDKKLLTLYGKDIEQPSKLTISTNRSNNNSASKKTSNLEEMYVKYHNAILYNNNIPAEEKVELMKKLDYIYNKNKEKEEKSASQDEVTNEAYTIPASSAIASVELVSINNSNNNIITLSHRNETEKQQSNSNKRKQRKK